MNAFSIIFLIEPFMYYKILTAQTGHALHVLKTVVSHLYARRTKPKELRPLPKERERESAPEPRNLLEALLK